MEHKKAQTGNDFRLFGHTMASYEQLSNHVKHNQCVQLKAEHLYHTERTDKWICKSHLDSFWGGDCLSMNPNINLCDEAAIQIFLGNCVTTSDGFKVCPQDPIVVEHLKTDDEPVLPNLHDAFEYGRCFKVDHAYICEDDLEAIQADQCVDVTHY